MNRQSGFTLLEAIVAMALLAGAGMALFAWINTSILSLQRIEASGARNAAATNIIEFMQSVNPMVQASGDRDFGEYRIHWKAVAIAGPRSGLGYPRSSSNYKMALYNCDIQVSQATNPNWFTMQLKLVGYIRVRETINVLGVGAP